MVYSNKFVMCVLLNGRPQKELANGVVSLPFGTEYALRFRNKNNRRAVVQIYIDGENVSGGGYIVNAHDFVDIKRHHDIDRAFKFVSLDSEDAIDYGKDGPNHDKVKGTIEARFYLEKELPRVIYRDVHHDHHHHHHHDHYHPRPKPWPVNPPIWLDNSGPTYRSKPDGMIYPTNTAGGMSSGQIKSDLLGGSSFTCDAGDADISCSTGGGGTSMSAGPRKMRSRSKSATFNAPAPPVEDLQDGCTVEGYSTGQNFYTAHCDTESTFTSLKIFLQGYDEEDAPVEVAKKRPAKKRPAKKRKTNKDVRIDDLEDENDQLRQEIEKLKADKRRKKQKAEKEKNLKDANEKLKKELEELQKED